MSPKEDANVEPKKSGFNQFLVGKSSSFYTPRQSSLVGRLRHAPGASFWHLTQAPYNFSRRLTQAPYREGAFRNSLPRICSPSVSCSLVGREQFKRIAGRLALSAVKNAVPRQKATFSASAAR